MESHERRVNKFGSGYGERRTENKVLKLHNRRKMFLDKKICGTICICQMTIVLSCVSFVYLSVAIYAPSHKAFNIGMNPMAVMCQTINSSLSRNCSWASCGEWCLTKTTGFCPQIYVNVRQNGTNLVLENCTRMNSVSCPPANEENLKKFNCNNPSECNNLTGIFKCRLGHCANLSEIYHCRHQADTGLIINSDTDNLKLNGVFDCTKAKCLQVKHKFKCDRYCNKITTTTMNVYLKYNDNLQTAECTRAIAFNEAQENLPGHEIDPIEIWSARKNGGVLLGICTDIATEDENHIKGWDCVNGTIVQESVIPPTFMNFSQFWSIYDNSTVELDKMQRFMPMEQHLTIYNKSRLFINLEGCVNTLRNECRDFYRTHGRNGSENSGHSQFPCFYNMNDSSLALSRFDLHKTWVELMLAVCIPGSLFMVSFVTLMVITQTVRVGDDARMRCKWCTDAENADKNTQYQAIAKYEDNKTVAVPSTEASNERFMRTNDEVAMQNLYQTQGKNTELNFLQENTN